MNHNEIILVEGKSKTIFDALHWPGLNRLVKGDESAALEHLQTTLPRYSAVLARRGVEFPKFDTWDIVERRPGDRWINFGGAQTHERDQIPFTEAEFQTWSLILEAIWEELDAQIALAEGKMLRKGPRGGGRELEKIIDHVIEADKGYLSKIAVKFKSPTNPDPAIRLAEARTAIRDALQRGMRGELPDKRPRGGEVWPLRYYFRVVAQHALNHAWEIEERLEP